MSWESALYKTYENNLSIVGENIDGHVLAPVGHIIANVQLEVMINHKGEFLGAMQLEKEDGRTLIPVTEASASRSSGIEPHPLTDTLSYIAGDYGCYVSVKEAKKSNQKNETYLTNLRQWSESEYSHSKVKAIYKYLVKKSLMGDLIASKLVTLDKNGLLDSQKIAGTAYEKVMVRFSVNIPDDDSKSGTWKDISLMECYQKYYISQQKENDKKEDICYLSGEKQIVSVNHPKGIVAANYGAKLISANDTSGFVYRGRFVNAEEASVIGYESSQKVHAALSWLVNKQGYSIGNTDKRTYVCWNPKGKTTPNMFSIFDDEEEDTDQSETLWRKKIKEALYGKVSTLEDNDDIFIIVLDAATTGRLSITYYNELKASDFLERLEYWADTCKWYQLKFTQERKPYYSVATPDIIKIIKAAFGIEHEHYLQVNDKVLKEQSQRMVHCMIDRVPIPYDIVHALVKQASNLIRFKSNRNREEILSIACAMITKFYFDKGMARKDKEDKLMNLDLENHDRSYLFGRLLAVYEYAERKTYSKDEEGRETNAIRLQSAYINHPAQTMLTLQQVTEPYFRKLKPSHAAYYRDLISEIVASIEEEDKDLLNRKLNEQYLLGYYLQRKELKFKKEEKSEDNDINLGGM